MHKYQMVSLIPARGGSTRIPRKNIKMMAGKPMIAWSIEASLQSKHISRTFVSTEDKEIKKVALQYGAEVIDRPQKYATDKYDSTELCGVVQQFKEHFWDSGYMPTFLCFLYPTSPLRTAGQIDGAYELMIEKNCNQAFSAYRIDEGYFKESFIINSEGKAERNMHYTAEENRLRLLHEKFSKDIYIFSADVYIMEFKSALPYTYTNYSDLAIYEIDRLDVIDVNSEKEFRLAERVLEVRNKCKNLSP